MATTEVPVKPEPELAPVEPSPSPAPAKVDTPVDVMPEKTVDPPSTVADDSKALAVAEKTPAPEAKVPNKSLDRDVALSELEKEKKLSFIKAWEETEKSKVENKAQKELSAITAWENTRRADIEAKLKQIEEKMDKKKAEQAEKMKNKVGLIHKQAEEKRAMVEAQKGENKLKAEELAAKYRATGTLPKKFLVCFGG